MYDPHVDTTLYRAIAKNVPVEELVEGLVVGRIRLEKIVQPKRICLDEGRDRCSGTRLVEDLSLLQAKAFNRMSYVSIGKQGSYLERLLLQQMLDGFVAKEFRLFFTVEQQMHADPAIESVYRFAAPKLTNLA